MNTKTVIVSSGESINTNLCKGDREIALRSIYFKKAPFAKNSIVKMRLKYENGYHTDIWTHQYLNNFDTDDFYYVHSSCLPLEFHKIKAASFGAQIVFVDFNDQPISFTMDHYSMIFEVNYNADDETKATGKLHC